MPICCATGAVWPTRPGGSKIRPIASTWNSAPPGLTVPAGANCDGRPPSLRASNSRAFVFVTSASPCSLPSKSAGPLLLSRHLCPDGKKNMHRLKQSVSWWCFAQGELLPQTLVRAAADIGYEGIELVDQEYWPLIKEHDLSIVSTAAGLSIEQGLNRREHHAHLEQKIRAALHLAEQWSIPTIIVFSGNRQGLSDQAGIEITAEGLSRVAQAAEDAGVTLAIELLNSKVDHLDYQCDHTAWGVEVCRLVNSPRVKLLYDIYHMQIMEGDIIRTIREYHPYFAHYHTAGNPGRHEIDETQEINYAPIVRALLETGYTGYLGQEFLPLGDPIAALKQAFDLCNIVL